MDKTSSISAHRERSNRPRGRIPICTHMIRGKRKSRPSYPFGEGKRAATINAPFNGEWYGMGDEGTQPPCLKGRKQRLALLPMVLFTVYSRSERPKSESGIVHKMVMSVRGRGSGIEAVTEWKASLVNTSRVGSAEKPIEWRGSEIGSESRVRIVSKPRKESESCRVHR
jgi:hypothetical protein